LFIAWVVLGPSVEVEIDIGGFAVHSVAQRAVKSPINNLCPGREVTLTFGLYGEQNALMDAVYVVREVLQLLR
jgi:hypothetical protein